MILINIILKNKIILNYLKKNNGTKTRNNK